MTIGKSSNLLSEKAAEKRRELLDELEQLTQEQLNAHSSALKQQLADVRRTTDNATSQMSQSLEKQLKQIEISLSTAVNQAEKLNRTGGWRSWMRSAAITLSVMLAVGGVTAGGLLMTDRLIDSRMERLSTLRDEIQRLESLPRLPQGVEIRSIQGQPFLIGIDPQTARSGTINNGKTPVIQLTQD